MSAFAEALEVLFFDANLSVEIWPRDSEGQFTRARGILRRPDEITEFGSARLMSDTTRIDVRVADMATQSGVARSEESSTSWHHRCGLLPLGPGERP